MIMYVTCTPQTAMSIKLNSFHPTVNHFLSSDCNHTFKCQILKKLSIKKRSPERGGVLVHCCLFLIILTCFFIALAFFLYISISGIYYITGIQLCRSSQSIMGRNRKNNIFHRRFTSYTQLNVQNQDFLASMKN